MIKPTDIRVTSTVQAASVLYLDALAAGRRLDRVVRSSAARFRIEFSDEAIEWHPAATVELHMRGRAIRSWLTVGPVELTDGAFRALKLAELAGNLDRAEYAP